MAELSALMHSLPLPLAQLLRRALNGKSPVERHHNAYYLAEAALKLAAAARIGVWMSRCAEPNGALARQLEALVLPSVGHWRDFLRDTDRAIAARSDAALLPLGAAVGGLGKKRAEWTAVRAFAVAVEEAGAVSQEVARAASQKGVLGFFNLITAYRNEVMGHGAQRRAGFYEQLAPLLLAALAEIFSGDDLFGGLRLAQARLVLADDHSEPTRAWQNLTGLASLPLAAAHAAAAPEGVAGQLFLVAAGVAVPLHPLVVYREDEVGLERVGFLNKTVRRTARDGDGRVDEVRRADYLDYATGENLAGIDTREALTALLGRLRGRAVTGDELRAVEDASVAAVADFPVETVAAGAAIGDFEILDELGRGGMGIVYRARQRSLLRTVALKVLPPSLTSDRVAVARFRREVAALARCDHPNVVKILTSGTDGDRSYYAMELVDGADLGRVARVLSRWQSSGTGLREGHLAAAVSSSGGSVISDGEPAQEEVAPPPELGAGRWMHLRLAELFADAAEGLAHLHERGIVHRDVKPGNLLLTSDGRRVVVMDLGLAQLADAGQLTKSDVKLVGTLRYMAPEQAQRSAASVDHRADIYGLGASLYELATGRPIFDGDSEARLLAQVIHEEPAPPRRVAPTLPHDLATIITTATAKDPARRYATAHALALDLRAFARGRPIAAVPPSLFHAALLFARRRRALVAAALTLLALVGAAGLLWWNWNRARVEYAANLVRRWEVMEGVAPLTVEEQRRSEDSYRITRQRGRTVRVERINGAGQLDDDDEEHASWEFIYGESGKVSEIVLRDHNGQPNLRWVYSGDLARADRRDGNNQPRPVEDTDVTVNLFEYDARGYRRSQRFANPYGLPRMDGVGAFGYAFVSDERGQVLQMDALGPDGRPSLTRDGHQRMIHRYDDAGNVLQESELDGEGHPVLLRSGVAGWRASYDRAGNPIGLTYFDLDGKPTLDQRGIAGWRRSYDEHGNRIELVYLGLDERPILHRSGYAISRARFDPQGNMIEESFFDTDGKPTLQIDGNAIFRGRYDERRNLTEASFFGVDGLPTVIKEGSASIRTRYDERGNRIEQSYFGVDGRPALHVDGYSSWRNRYDERSNLIEVAYFGTDGTRVPGKSGWAIFRGQYDERGNQIEVGWFGVDGQPTLSQDAYAVRRERFNERNNEVERSYFGVDGKPTLNKDGAAVVRRSWNERGDCIATEFFGIDGRPILHKDGFARIRMRYDERGRMIEQASFDVDDRPTLRPKEGASIFRFKYDRFGHRVATSYFGVDGRATLNRDRYAEVRRRFDSRGNQIEESYHGLDGTPVASSAGYALVKKSYDGRSRPIEESYFGVDGKPIADASGHAIVRTRYDAADTPQKSYFGVDGNQLE